MERLRAVDAPAVPPEIWTAMVFALHGLRASPQALVEAFDRLSALYEFEMNCRKMVRNSNFDVRKNLSDHVDAQQLAYLCDPEVIFITADSDFKTRTARSKQSGRIKSFADLLAHARGNVPLA